MGVVMAYRHALIRSLVMYYLDHFGYKGPRVRVFTTPSRVLRELERKREWTPEEERLARKDFGWCYGYSRSTVIYVNAKKHDTLGDLLDTCAHEALHACRPPGHRPSLIEFEGEIAEAVLA